MAEGAKVAEACMIDRQGGKIVVECDSCDETIDGPEDDGWEALWSRAKAEGWKARKIGHDWVHGCPECEV